MDKVPLTITANNETIKKGTPKPTFMATVRGLVKDEKITGITFTNAPADTNTVGISDITPAGGTITGGTVSSKIDNYTITYVNGTLTITDQDVQTISYPTTEVTKRYSTEKFTNALTQTTVVGAITYVSGTPTVATVDGNGEVTIVGTGTTTITATAAATVTHACGHRKLHTNRA